MAQKKRSSAKGKAKKEKSGTNNNCLPIHLISAFAVSVFFGIFMYCGSGGVLSDMIRNFLVGLFGTVAYGIPVTLFCTALYLAYTKNVRKFWIKFALIVLAYINLSSIIQLATALSFDSVLTSYGNGGTVGGFVAVMLVKLVQKAGAYAVLIISLPIILGAIAGTSALKVGAEYMKSLGNFIYGLYAKAASAAREARENAEYREKPPTQAGRRNASTATESARKVPAFFDDAGEEHIMSNGIDEVFGAFEEEKAKECKKENKQENKQENKKTEQPKDTAPQTATAEKPDTATIAEFDNAIEHETIAYTFPPIELLNKAKDETTDHRTELRRTAEKLISVLENFNVRAKLLQVTQGPAVTRYEIQPDIGVKLSKISGLADDIALNLAVSTVLVAPVQGKAAVGIEIPNNKVSSVGIREILSADEFKNAKSKLTFALGKDIGGGVVIGDIARMPHLLIAGATGSGKSVCINTIIMSLLYKADPNEVKLIMVDPKVVELGVYNGIPHLLVPVVTDPKKAAGALNWAVAEMLRRYELFKETGVRKLEAYNKLMESTGGEKVPQLVIIIDELADLMMVAAKEVEDYICRIAQLARAAGIHLIIATQRPSVDVITGLIKANIPSRIAFAVSSSVDSRTIIDKGGAEKLLGMGDMLFAPTYERDSRRVQGAFVSDGEIEKVLNFIKEHSGENNTYSEDLAEQIERVANGENGVTPDKEEDGDPLLNDAINLAMELGKISTSMVQRRLGVGYSRAGRIIDQMEARGIISGANGSKPRDVLLSYADFNRMSEAEDDEE